MSEIQHGAGERKGESSARDGWLGRGRGGFVWTPAPVRLLVFGSRTWDLDAPLNAALAALAPSVVIEGEARGADFLSRVWASAHGIPVEKFPVDTRIDGPWPAAGHRRNARMHREGKPTHAIGFVSGLRGQPLSRGSAGMAEICKRAGTPLRIVREDGEDT